MNPKIEDFHGALHHGDAWRYFLESTNRDVTARVLQERWRWFIAGWKSKCQQHNDLRKRR